jgi:hypothetical protein
MQTTEVGRGFERATTSRSLAKGSEARDAVCSPSRTAAIF